MTIRRFRAPSHRDAIRQVRDALGDDAVIVSTRNSEQGAEIFAISEAQLSQLHDGDQTPTNATQDFSMLAQELLGEVQDMRAMLHQSQGSQAPNDHRKQLYRVMRSGGYSDELARRLVALLPRHLNQKNSDYGGAESWLKQQLVSRIAYSEQDSDLLKHRGVMALVGPTGVGKTTTTAKLAANYVMEHGNDSLLLVTTDSYRIGAQQQLAIYAELLNVEMYALADGATLDALQEKMRGKRLILVDTVGMSQRDQRLAHKIAALGAQEYRDATRMVLLLNAASQQETLDEVARIYQQISADIESPIQDCILTKLDEAAKLGGVLDTVIRHQFKVTACSNGQRVPEDLVQANIEQIVQDSLPQLNEESLLAQSEWEQPLDSTHGAHDIFNRGHVIQSCMQQLRAELPHFGLFEKALEQQRMPASWTANDFPAERAAIRWASPQPLQGWQRLTPHLALNATGLPLLSPVLQHPESTVEPNYGLAPLQLFDYLPEAALLDMFTEHKTGWLATLNINHRLPVNGHIQPVRSIVKQHAIPLKKVQILYRGEQRRLELSIAAVDAQAGHPPAQILYGELHGGAKKNPVQRRYWLVDGHCTADQVVERARLALQQEEFGRLTRLAWQALESHVAVQSSPESRQQLLLALASNCAAIAMHVEYHSGPRFANLRGELLGFTGKRGRVQGDKLVSGVIQVVQAHRTLVVAGKSLAV